MVRSSGREERKSGLGRSDGGSVESDVRRRRREERRVRERARTSRWRRQRAAVDVQARILLLPLRSSESTASAANVELIQSSCL